MVKAIRITIALCVSLLASGCASLHVSDAFVSKQKQQVAVKNQNLALQDPKTLKNYHEQKQEQEQLLALHEKARQKGSLIKYDSQSRVDELKAIADAQKKLADDLNVEINRHKAH
ncbi:hypothetical protein [Polycladidibacter stylochi]|uniref:hypothetical protein n=1 Tax=Polycladidibacter stylochi TaxID=1807766 RepID=UPI000832C9A6|nr:hypothetical protein [Pseudovibrio stylochi]